MSQTEDAVSRHYTRGDLGQRILDGLAISGANMQRLRPEDTTPVDQFHIGGRAATLELARLAGIQPGWQVLDVGGGIGGAARTLASTMRCQVTVLDVTEEYVQVGAMLSERMDLAGLVHFRHGSGLQLPFADGKFDAVWTQHSSMNIADKERLYAEARRVLRARGRLAIHEVAAGPVQPVRYPAPWSADGRNSFLPSQEELRSCILAAGFRQLAWEDVSQASLEWFRRVAPPFANGSRPPLGMHLLMGERAAEAVWGQVHNLEQRRLEVVQAAFERK
jgi:SAM-dependent methyltransferase